MKYFIYVLQFLFVTLKVFGFVNWTWLATFTPLITYATIFFAVVILICMSIYIAIKSGRKREVIEILEKIKPKNKEDEEKKKSLIEYVKNMGE